MASRRTTTPAKHLFNGFRHYNRPHQRRSLTTEPPQQPTATLAQTYIDAHLTSTPTEPILEDNVSISPPTLSTSTSPIHRAQPIQNPFLTTCMTTLHSFPALAPTSFAHWPSTHLAVPLRKDILHRAVVFEGDNTRSGTANTKTRYEVHGSNRKIRPQKGTGRARLGDKKSPMLRGGGVAFGPRTEHNFKSDLQRAVYDLAWRTALSYRYRKGELLVLDGEAEITDVHPSSRPRYLRDLLQHNRMGHADGRTLFVTLRQRGSLWEALAEERMGREAKAKDVGDVDVKDLLEMGRIVVERRALERMFREHEDDLNVDQRLRAWRRRQIVTVA